MVIVFLKNGEKAPMMDANFVRLETPAESEALLRCFYNEREVGVFKWAEVAGYTTSSQTPDPNAVRGSYDAWTRRIGDSL